MNNMNTSPSFLFGGKAFPLRSLNRHLCFLGSTGSGKSVSIRQVLQSFLPEIGAHAQEGGYRAVIYDAKQDTMGMLWELADMVRCPVRLTNPYELRSSSWRVAADITSPAAAYEMANIWCPVSENAAQPFFENAVVNLLSGVLKALHLRAPGQWDLRTVVLVMRSENHLKELLSQTSETRHLARRYFQEGKLTQSIMATVDTKMESYATIAALWSKATSSFSLREFRDSESIMILGSNEESRIAIDAINRALFQRLSELLLAQGDSDTRRTLLCLDELREAGELPVSSLALRGRSRGVVLMAGAQDLEGLEAVYGKEIAHELLGQFAYKAILRQDNPATARWSSDLWGATEVKENNRQMSRSVGGSEVSFTQGVGETLRERDVVLPNEIMSLPITSRKSGLHGFYKTPYGGFQAAYDFVSLLQGRKDRAPVPSGYNFQERPEAHQYLADWTGEELARFGLTPVPPEELSASASRNRERPNRPRDMNRDKNRRPRRPKPLSETPEEPDDDEDDDED